MIVEEIIQQCEGLSFWDRARVRDWLNDRIREEIIPGIKTEEELLAVMEAKGIVTRPKRDVELPDWYHKFEPVKVEGEPLSETIIRERR